MADVPTTGRQVLKPHLPPEYFAGEQDVAVRRRALIDAINKERTPELDTFMLKLAKKCGIMD